MTEIAFLHALAYASGKDPIDNAVDTIAMNIGHAADVQQARIADPAAYPIHGPDVSDEHFARRVLADLLNAGWHPPTLDEVTRAAAQARTDIAEGERTAHLPCTCGHPITTHAAAPGNRCTDCRDCWSFQPDEGDQL